MEYNRVEVLIGGKRYTLRTQESPDYIRDISRQLDKRLQDIFALDEKATLADAAVLAALDILDETTKTNSNIDHIRKQVKQYVEEAAALRKELDECRKNLDDARQQADKLKTELDIYTLRDQIEKNRTK